MIINDKILVKNYKCFDSNGGGFEKVFPINIIIGKNNSGKSSLIDLIQFIVQPNIDFIAKGRDNSNAEVLITHELTLQEISSTFNNNTSGGGIPGRTHFEYGNSFIGKLYTYRLDEKDKRIFKSIENQYVPEARALIDGLASRIQKPFTNQYFCNIAAERDIVAETTDKDISLAPNGIGATNYVQQIINRTNRDSRLVEIELLKELNSIINPDIKFERIFVQQNDNNFWELYFEDFNSKRIALSKMGSGIKTVLLVLLNLIVRPVIEGRKKDSYIFAFEELENNLHPSLQRRLYNYIIKYSENNKTYFFLTTHSNVVIDTFGPNSKAQLIHVTNNGDISTSNTISSYNGAKQILKDLGIKASDLLQCNGVIWVEGPSDRNYINKWLEIHSPDLKEGLHYSIMFYGGRLLANLTFDSEMFKKEVIPLIKINKNAFVIIDRDGKTIDSELNETKTRINNEIGNDGCWITNGREIENYLSGTIISKWLFEKYGYELNINNDKYNKIEDNIINSNNKVEIKYNLCKTRYSSEISEYIDKDSINMLDLKENLDRLVERIIEWNK